MSLLELGITFMRSHGLLAEQKLCAMSSHTPFAREGRGLVTFVAPLCTVRDQSQRRILSHECCYHNSR